VRLALSSQDAHVNRSGKAGSEMAAATLPSPFTMSDGRVGMSPPAASADSMFCSDPITLKIPMGRMTLAYWIA